MIVGCCHVRIPLDLVVITGLFGILAGTGQTPDKFELSNDEKVVMERTNAERVKQTLPPLKPNAVLFRVARQHSSNMAKKNELKHELDGKTPAQRLRDAEYAYREMAENIASGTALTPMDAVELWMESEQHRLNILKEPLTEIGVGIVKAENGDVYYTQVFGTPVKRGN